MGRAAQVATIAMILCFAGGRTSAQTPAAETKKDVQTTPAAGAPPAEKNSESVRQPAHRFWDKENDWLFAGVGASRTLDYFSTLNMRRRGDQEILVSNDLVDDHAAFAVVEAAGTGVSIGASYLFHRYSHHKLERWTSIVHFGLAIAGAARNYSLKTVHTK